jgi:hypothetical protein
VVLRLADDVLNGVDVRGRWVWHVFGMSMPIAEILETPGMKCFDLMLLRCPARQEGKSPSEIAFPWSRGIFHRPVPRNGSAEKLPACFSVVEAHLPVSIERLKSRLADRDC